jgi:group I intron endonuclease
MLLTDWKDLKPTPLFHWVYGWDIYSLVNLDNGKRYVGRSQSVRERIKNHLYEINRHKHPNKEINADSNCKFAFELLEENVPREKRTERELYWILYYKSNDSRYGYNAKDPMFKNHHFKDKECESERHD